MRPGRSRGREGAAAKKSCLDPAAPPCYTLSPGVGAPRLRTITTGPGAPRAARGRPPRAAASGAPRKRPSLMSVRIELDRINVTFRVRRQRRVTLKEYLVQQI